jgi:rubrerythrin
MKDYLGDEMPEGYEAWMCPICTAVCSFEAMNQCIDHPECGFKTDKPESNGGAFGFMISKGPAGA